MFRYCLTFFLEQSLTPVKLCQGLVLVQHVSRGLRITGTNPTGIEARFLHNSLARFNALAR